MTNSQRGVPDWVFLPLDPGWRHSSHELDYELRGLLTVIHTLNANADRALDAEKSHRVLTQYLVY